MFHSILLAAAILASTLTLPIAQLEAQTRPNILVIFGDDIGWIATFKEFPIRQLGLSADVGKTIEGIQSQILKFQQAN
jgi:hypothetical protein